MKAIVKLAFSLLITVNALGQTNQVVNADEFDEGIKKQNPQILDVRTSKEFAEGHIQNAINIDWENSAKFKRKSAKLDKSKPVYIYCLAGVRSKKAAQWLASNGFNNVISLDGGIKAWKEAGKPVSQ